jgi:L-fuculose-phosphate aldolase
MSTETELREQLATLTRIFAMRGLLGLHGHISAYDPESARVFICPGSGWDKASTRAEDIIVLDRQGEQLAGEQRRPLEWPIHTALHAARPDALAVAHLHAPYATLFTVAQREFRPVLLTGRLFGEGVPTYPEKSLIKTPDQGRRLAELIGHRRAALLQAHGVVVAASNIQELLLSSVLLEENARAAVLAAALGELGPLNAEDCVYGEDDAPMGRRAQLCWNYLATMEARWDRQSLAAGPLA